MKNTETGLEYAAMNITRNITRAYIEERMKVQELETRGIVPDEVKKLDRVFDKHLKSYYEKYEKIIADIKSK